MRRLSPIRPAMRVLALVLALAFSLPGAVFGALKWRTQQALLTPRPGETQATALFAFKNESDRPVTITDVRPSCPCTSVELTRRTYAPGEQGSIRAKVALGDWKGVQTKMIFVTTDDTRTPAILILRISMPVPSASRP
jgi:hypothetical protein